MYNKKFPCTGCGLCCMHIDTINALKKFDLGNGICKNLNVKEKKCNIYSSRPLICRVDELYHKIFKAKFDIRYFYEKNADVCNQLQKQHNINIKYKIYIK